MVRNMLRNMVRNDLVSKDARRETKDERVGILENGDEGKWENRVTKEDQRECEGEAELEAGMNMEWSEIEWTRASSALDA